MLDHIPEALRELAERSTGQRKNVLIAAADIVAAELEREEHRRGIEQQMEEIEGWSMLAKTQRDDLLDLLALRIPRRTKSFPPAIQAPGL